MAVQVDGNAPYAPFSVIKNVIERHRQVGLTSITTDVLQRMGVTESLAPRSVQALKLLDLIDEGGKPTPAFEVIRKASSGDVGARLAELLRQVYEPVFAVMDPTVATSQQITDAFRGFKPSGQRERMVTLFTGLMQYAGMVSDMPKRAPGPRSQASTGTKTIGRSSSRATATGPGTSAAATGGTASTTSSSASDDHTRTVLLRSGGSITLGVDLNPLLLRGAERTFFNALVDLLDDYEGAPNAAGAVSPGHHDVRQGGIDDGLE